MLNHFDRRIENKSAFSSQDLESSDIDMEPLEEEDVEPADTRTVPVREFKYGICHKHNRALHRCPLFRAYVGHGQRRCWTQELYKGDPKHLPKGVQTMQRNLKRGVRWNLQHGSCSRSTG